MASATSISEGRGAQQQQRGHEDVEDALGAGAASGDTVSSSAKAKSLARRCATGMRRSTRSQKPAASYTRRPARRQRSSASTQLAPRMSSAACTT